MEKIYSMTELFNKYNLQYARGGKSSDKEKYLKSVGIIIQEVPNNFKKKKTYKVIDDSLFTSKEWTRHPTKNLELTKKGQVRNSNNKVIYIPRLTTNGYIQIGDNLLHRLLMETFNPIFQKVILQQITLMELEQIIDLKIYVGLLLLKIVS